MRRLVIIIVMIAGATGALAGCYHEPYPPPGPPLPHHVLPVPPPPHHVLPLPPPPHHW